MGYNNKKKNYKNKRKYNKSQYRQQKLAVATVKKIAKTIARREDKKNMMKYVHVSTTQAAGTTWIDKRAIPALTTFKTISGNAQDANDNLSYDLVSAIGGTIAVENQVQLVSSERDEVELRIHGIQTFGIVKNNANRPARIECRLIYIPNVNQYTVASIDYLTPRMTMFFKSGHGAGNLIRQGYNRRVLAAADGTGIPIKFQTLDRKVVYLPAATAVGTLTNGSAVEQLIYNTPAVFKRVTLSKYFKKFRKAFCRGTNVQLSDGNYFFVYWSDLPDTLTYSILATTNIQYSLKAPMNSSNT